MILDIELEPEKEAEIVSASIRDHYANYVQDSEKELKESMVKVLEYFMPRAEFIEWRDNNV